MFLELENTLIYLNWADNPVIISHGRGRADTNDIMLSRSVIWLPYRANPSTIKVRPINYSNYRIVTRPPFGRHL